ncbi:MAG: hypothetical protein M0Z85_00110 [Gammaproteobacteria bacterium]|nr:hypothetical protein [Gammaproteobacteria bacterium]
MTKHTKKIIGISAGSAVAAGALGWWYLSTHPAQSTVPVSSTTPSQTSASPGPSSTGAPGYTTNQTVQTPSATSAVLAWTAAPGATSYELINTATGATLATTTSTTYTLTGLTPGAYYQVAVVGCNASGCMAADHQGSVTWTQPVAVDAAAQTVTYQAQNSAQTQVVVSTVVPSGQTFAPPSQWQVNTLASVQDGTFVQPTETATETLDTTLMQYLDAHPSDVLAGYDNKITLPSGQVMYYSANTAGEPGSVYSEGPTGSYDPNS